MSSIEHPSAPRTPPPVAEVSEVNDDNRGQPSAEESSRTFATFYSSPLKPAIPRPTNRRTIEQHEVVKDDSICEDFLDQHLRAAPASFNHTEEMRAYVDEIREAGTSEPKMYKPATSLLTAISKELYKTLDKAEKDAHKERQHIRKNRPGHLTFIDHHSTAPTHFPNDALSDAKDAPDLLGVYDVDIFKDYKDAQGVYKGIPHHRVEAIVEAKSETNGGGRRQATTYAYRHHQARPDRPGFYVLVIKPQWYQVLYSDPTGVFASPRTPWTNTDLLAAYIYSHYKPPTNHFLWDDTIRWSEPDDEPCMFPLWEIDVVDKTYENCRFIFVGDPWSRLTSVFETEEANGEPVIIKDCYRHHGRRFKEEDILDHIHADGDLLGVIRLKVHESVKPLRFVLKGAGAKRSRERFVFMDTGSHVLKAKTLNDFLKVAYDALEVHRTKLLQRNILHRDMSMHNLLMYPVWGSSKERHVNKNVSPTIEDVLAGETRPVEDRFPQCLAIDYDNAAQLDRKVTKPQELMQRTGTPMYIARSVCLGEVLTDVAYRFGPPMPELSDEARTLYTGAYGKGRYERYNDKQGTCHGARPPNPYQKFETTPPFRHRPEHDVESIYWTMVAALLRVCPVNVNESPEAKQLVIDVWTVLLSHRIPDADSIYADPRDSLMMRSDKAWRALFLGDMEDVGTLLWDISQQVRPEYALFEDGLQPDHLHEAVQRLILQYLVDHEDVCLDPLHLRPITAATTVTVFRPSTQVSAKVSGTKSGPDARSESRVTRSSSRTVADTEAGGSTKRKTIERDSNQPAERASSSTSRARAARVPRAIVAEPKRKSSSQGERSSKRLRDKFGAPQSIEERVEEA